MQALSCGVRCENRTFFPNYTPNKMDYHQKMVVAPQQKFKDDDDDEDDLEALRLAALQSLKTKDVTQNRRQPLPQLQNVVPQLTQTSRPFYKTQRKPRRGYFHNRGQQRQNGNMYYQSPCNPNLIAIVPVDEHSALQQSQPMYPVKEEKIEACQETQESEVSKFHRFKDTGSGSEDDDNKDHKKTFKIEDKTEFVEKDNVENDEPSVDMKSDTECVESPQKPEQEQEDVNDDDDDILLMADLEEEDSLERLMDEMEREMNVDKPVEKREKKTVKKERPVDACGELSKGQDEKANALEVNTKKDSNNSPVASATVLKSERRSVSPRAVNRISQKRRSLSPKLRSRRKSPRRSPRKSPVRQLKKSQREMTRYRSPRMSPPRYSPRSRSPKLSPRLRSPRLSPRRSPNRSPPRRSPPRKLSPRGRSPKLSPHPRSPRLHRSRSPRISSRSKSPRPPRSPKVSRSKSPRLPRSRSPKYSPLRLSPQPRSRSKSPRQSPRRILSSRRLSPRDRSPGISSRARSPKLSPRRTSPRLRSPRLSPHRSPWSSPRNSPRLSPRRRRSPRWSPKEAQRKHGPQSISPDNSASPLYTREPSPMHKSRVSPETNRGKGKHRDDAQDKNVQSEVVKEPSEALSDPILEARRRKFESTMPIDPINANKKIKLTKKDDSSKKVENMEETELTIATTRKTNKVTEEFDTQDADLGLDSSYDFDDLDEAMDDTSPIAVTSSVNACIDVEPTKVEKDRSSKKKKKRDKEIYQVGKLKNELPLSERIGKDKKCKKRKDPVLKCTYEDIDSIFEETNADDEGDLRAELSRRRAERLNRTVPIQSARLVQSAFKGVVNEVVKNNAKVNQRHVIKGDEKSNQKDVRRVTVLHRSVPDLHDSEDETTLDSKVPVLLRLGLNKQVQETREPKASRKASKRQGRKE